MARKTVDQLEPMEVLSPADVEESADFCTEFVTLEEAEGYAVEFAKAVLFGYGFTEEAIESTVNGYANDMWLKQHPNRKSSPWQLEEWRTPDTGWKFDGPGCMDMTDGSVPTLKVPVKEIYQLVKWAEEKDVCIDSKRIVSDWLSEQEEGNK